MSGPSILEQGTHASALASGNTHSARRFPRLIIPDGLRVSTCTTPQNRTLHRVQIDREHDDWIHYWAEKQNSQIRCRPLNLSEANVIFMRWFDSE